MQINKLFYSFIISFFFSIFTFYVFDNFLYQSLFFLLLTSSIYLIFIFNKTNKSFFLNILFTISFAFFFGMLWANLFAPTYKGDFDNLINTEIQKKFVIVDEPVKKNFHTKIIVQFQNSKSKAIVWIPNYPTFQYGDLIEIKGALIKTRNFKKKPNSNLKNKFDYVSYLKKDHIFYEIRPYEIQFIKHHQGNSIKEKLYNFKNFFLSKIKKYIPAPESFLLGGIELGAQEDLGPELISDFRKTGIIHIVVLSGYNLTLIADFFMNFFSFLGITVASSIGSIGIILFTIMVGGSATIIRAAIMALILLFAKWIGRESETTKMLFLAGFFMVLFNPMILVYDPSFQLSFLATLGLVLLSKKIENKLHFLPNIFELKSILSATIATQIFVAPLLLYMMNQISIISPLVNILILIFVPFTMFCGLLMFLFSFLSPMIASIISFLLFLILRYDLMITSFFAKLPISTVSLNISAYTMFFIYFLYLLIFLYYRTKNDNNSKQN